MDTQANNALRNCTIWGYVRVTVVGYIIESVDSGIESRVFPSLNLGLGNHQDITCLNERVLKCRILSIGTVEVEQHVDSNDRRTHILQPQDNRREVCSTKRVLVVIGVKFFIGEYDDDIFRRAGERIITIVGTENLTI